jgi:predicted dehydrogenase
MSTKLKVGIIGAGGIVRMAHLGGWRNNPNVEVIGIADIDGARARALAKECNVPHAFADFKELLQLDLDIVDVCTPNCVHTPAVLAALEAGKNVICEKPLATTTKEVRQMGELADKKKLKLMTAQHHRFSNSAQAIKHWTGARNLGDVYHARVRATRRAWLPVAPGFIDKKLSGGGPCMDIGVHALDVCMWLMEFPTPVRVTGSSKVNFAKGHAIPGMWGEWDRHLFSVEDFAAGFVHFDNGATMTVEASWLGHQQENEDMSCQVFGAKAGVKWPSAEFATVQGGVFGQGTLTNPRSVERAHWEELKAFYQCVVNDTPSPVPWTETIKVIGILEGIYESQNQGREVNLNL